MRYCLEQLLQLAPHYEKQILHEGDDYNPDADMKITPILEKLLIQLDEVEAGRQYSYEKILDTYLIKYTNPSWNT
jgi:hypothetical protein